MVEVRDPGKTREEIVRGLRQYFDDSGFHRAVVGVSGGVDSSVALALTAQALSPRNVFAVMLSSRETPKGDISDVADLISVVGIGARNVYHVRIDRIVRSIDSSLGGMTKMERANATARVRMILLHAIAYRKRALVVGSGDRSEISIGFYTKYGDGGVDVQPLGRLLKTQVRHMAAFLGLPRAICEKPSSPRLWAGHLAEKEIGVSYETVDEFIHLHEDKGMSVGEIAAKIGVRRSVLESIKARMLTSAHKRNPPPIIECDPF
jgi:NAD+ synthase